MSALADSVVVHRDRGRSHERKHHSSSSSAKKQRYYSCDRYPGRESCQPKPTSASCAVSPSDEPPFSKQPHAPDPHLSPLLARPLPYVSVLADCFFIVSSCRLAVVQRKGAHTPGRGRRQLPQTPLTPRPGVAYRTANSSPVPTAAGGISASGVSTSGVTASGVSASGISVGGVARATGPCPGRLSRGLSEHEALLWGETSSPMPVTRIGSDPNLGQPHPQDGGASAGPDLFQDALSSQAGAGPGRAPRTGAPGSQQQGRGVPNGYHFALGLSAGPGSSAAAPPCHREAQEEEWC
ncbi:hypothetical protein JZ751_028912 [Albula glossodonta]|uniref:Uncharacterized protein n=1 Tax=Albula glossodonta TaxID=121402 RepID=A0A8T2NBK3_9TELE|nr:hypothetical protein JZ751_028912 [Albula glossodonta]